MFESSAPINPPCDSVLPRQPGIQLGRDEGA